MGPLVKRYVRARQPSHRPTERANALFSGATSIIIRTAETNALTSLVLILGVVSNYVKPMKPYVSSSFLCAALGSVLTIRFCPSRASSCRA